MVTESKRRRLERPASRQRIAVLELVESEPPGTAGENDHVLLGGPLTGFGARAGQNPRAAVTGNLLPLPTPLPLLDRLDGAIPLAHPISVPTGTAVVVSQEVGDGPFGGGGAVLTGDFDFFGFPAEAGQRIEISVRTPDPLGPLNPIVALYDGGGNLLAFNDVIPLPGFLETLDSYLAYTTENAGNYFIAVGGHSSVDPDETELDMLPSDPFDAGSGPGVGSEGIYDLVIGLDAARPADVDVFRVELEAGDVIGATVLGHAASVALVNETNDLLVASFGADLSGIYPAGSPLPGGGRATIARVIDTPGTYGVEVSRAVGPAGGGDGSYRLELGAFRSPLDLEEEEARQILFLDFDGATLDLGTFGVQPQFVTLSPLRNFLPRWGLTSADENAVIDAIVRTVEEDLSEDIRRRGKNGDFTASGIFGDFDVEILNSRDHPDQFGSPRVSRVIVGGSIEEFRLQTIGIAESIDVGNFATEETAVVLLDLLSEPAPDPNSLTSVERAPGTTIVDLVGTAVGNIAAHEAGHLFANFHTARDIGPATIMDRGGNVPHVAGAGEDGVFGSPDDEDVDFGPDLYEPLEAFTGEEKTLDAISFGLPAGGGRPEITVWPRAHDFGAIVPGSAAQQVLRVANDGNRDLPIPAAPFIEPGGTDFSIVDGASVSTLPPGTSHAVTVRFAPGGLGRQQAVLRIESGLDSTPTLDVALSGQGGAPAIGVGAFAHDYGDLFYGDASTSIPHTIVVANTGTGELEVTAFVFVGPHPRAFRIATEERLLVPAGETAEATVLFQPGGAVGSLQADLAILGNDPAAPRLDVRLSGRAFGPDLTVFPPSPFSFGATSVGDHRSRSFLVINEGNRDLAVSATTLVGEDKALFTIESGQGAFTVAPDGVHELVVGFTPEEVGERCAMLRFESNDPDEPAFDLELEGKGVQPDIRVDPPSYDFGPLAVNTQSFKNLRIGNEGGEALSISAVTLTGPDTRDFAIVGAEPPFGIRPGSWVEIQLIFQPLSLGEKLTTLRIASNDPEVPIADSFFEGRGVSTLVPEPTIPTHSEIGLMIFGLLLATCSLSVLRSSRGG